MSDLQAFIDFLQNYHDDVFACEKRALEAIEAGNSDEYKKQMRLKAEKMAALEDATKDRLEPLSRDVRGHAGSMIQHFSYMANKGLEIGSPFFWSALLWNEDADPSQPDNLQLLINDLKSELDEEA